MDVKWTCLIFVVLFLWVHRTDCKYSKVRFRGKELDLHGKKGDSHFEKVKEVKKRRIFERSILMNPRASEALYREIGSREHLMEELHCRGSCAATAATTENNDADENYEYDDDGTTKNTVILTLQGDDDDEYYEDIFEDFMEDYDDTTTEAIITPHVKIKSRINTVHKNDTTFLIPPFARSKFKDIDGIVPESQIGDECDFYLYNHSIGYYLKSLYSKQEISEQDEEMLQSQYELTLLDISATENEKLNRICLNEFSIMSCHEKKQYCVCGSFGRLQMVQQMGAYTCTAALGSYCEEPYIYCTEDYDCVNRTCVSHNY